MKKQTNGMAIVKKVLLVLMALDSVSLILTGVALFPTFKRLAGNGTLMLVVALVLVAVAVAAMLFEILAKLFLIRSASRNSGGSGYVVFAAFLMVINVVAALINWLSTGGEGANLINQGRMYLQILASVAEVITVGCYLHVRKKLAKSGKENEG